MLLDTNAISAWAQRDSGVLGVLRSDHPWFLPSIALGEYYFGLMSSTMRVVLEKWLSEVEVACVVLAPDARTARHYAEVRDTLRRANTPIPYYDIWIAALAIQHGLPVVSRDAHFDRISGIRRIGWQRDQDR
jgi:tRNA(fMet)-specific endonuclease VapC